MLATGILKEYYSKYPSDILKRLRNQRHIHVLSNHKAKMSLRDYFVSQRFVYKHNKINKSFLLKLKFYNIVKKIEKGLR